MTKVTRILADNVKGNSMTDKVQKIREEVEKLMYGFNLEADIASCEDAGAEKLADIKYQLCKKILEYIDSLQEEPVSEDLEEAAKHYLYSNILYDDVYVGNPTDKDCIEMFKAGAEWGKNQAMAEIQARSMALDHGCPEEPVSIWHSVEELLTARECEYILVIYEDTTAPCVAGNKTQVSYWDRVDKWAYLDDVINISNVERTVKNWKEIPISNSLDYAKMTIQRLEKRRMLPTLKGKNLHDFKNEFNTIKQILHLHVYPGSQEIIAYHFALHWATWGATHLKDLFAVADSDSKKMDNKQPVSDDLEKAAKEWEEKTWFTPFYMTLDDNGNPNGVRQDYTTHAESFKAGAKWQKQQTISKACKWIEEKAASDDLKEAADNALESITDQYDIISVGSCLEMFRLGAKWQKTQEYTCYEEAFEDGAKWKKEQIEEALLSEVLPCFMHGGESDEVVVKLDEVLNQKK